MNDVLRVACLVQVLSDAVAAGGRVIAITNTLSQPSDGVTEALLSKVPDGLSEQLHCYSAAGSLSSSSSSSGADGEDGDSSSSGGFSSASLAAAAAQVKQKGAQQFVAQLQQDMATLNKAGVPVTLDAGLMAAGAESLAAGHSWQCHAIAILQDTAGHVTTCAHTQNAAVG
jgi:hypothetical protein